MDVQAIVAHTTMVYDELTAEENLVFFARLQNVELPEARAEELLREVGLIERRASPVRTFSRGMRQRIAMARTDSPPFGAIVRRTGDGSRSTGHCMACDSLRELNEAGCTIVMSLQLSQKSPPWPPAPCASMQARSLTTRIRAHRCSPFSTLELPS